MPLTIPDSLSPVPLSSLCEKFKNLKLIGPDNGVSFIVSDSRMANGTMLYCLYDEFVDKSISYIDMALQKKCSSLLVGEQFYYNNLDYFGKFPGLGILLSRDNPRVLHGKLASFFLGEPSQKLKIIAVTGTNGKTTVTNCLYKLFQSMGFNSGLIGTISIEFGNFRYDSANTTPDPSVLQSILKEMLNNGVEYVFMEASSHGLKLNRMDGTNLWCGIFTNLTPDHLDFHPDMDDYLRSKFRLFQLLGESIHINKFGIVSRDSPGGNEILQLASEADFSFPILKFGKSCEYFGDTPNLSLSGTEFTLHHRDDKTLIRSKLLGYFNFMNISMVYICSLNLLPEKKQEIIEKLALLEPVTGRFEIVRHPTHNKLGIVDYAHTPDALENILKSIRGIPHSMLITVFGCGGDRDKTKRPVMGEIACKLSDHVYITSDNPRTEDPLNILRDIESGIKGSYQNYTIESDRRKAIEIASRNLPENGFLLVAGKGHENYQIIGTQKYPFSDVEELSKAFLF